MYQESTFLVWFTYIDDTFFFWTDGKEDLKIFSKEFNNLFPHLKFIYGFSEK